MTPWSTLALAALLGLCAAGLNPSLVHTPWSAMESAFQVSHPLFLATLALALLLAGTGLELKGGRWSPLAAWGLPCLAQFYVFGRCWPELSATSLVVSVLVLARLRGEALPWRIWVPLCLCLGLTLWVSQPPFTAVLVSILLGAGVGRYCKSEAVAVLGMAAGGALLLAWLS